jgi:hypothetical protein
MPEKIQISFLCVLVIQQEGQMAEGNAKKLISKLHNSKCRISAQRKLILMLS